MKWQRFWVFISFTLLFVAPATTSAAPLVGLIKTSGQAVYYYGEDGKRYVFPNEKTYRTWYSDFSNVQVISDSELGSIAIGGNVTYRPGVKLVKITTDPKVYAIGTNGTLRWVKTETAAAALYGVDWAKQVDDVPDVFFTNYHEGLTIERASDFDAAAVRAAAVTISTDKSINVPAPVAVQSFMIEADDAGFYPNTITVTKGATVRLTFKVRSAGVYFAGLDFKSSLFPTANAAIGQSVTVEFTAPSASTAFSSYWPSSGVLKTTSTVNVQ